MSLEAGRPGAAACAANDVDAIAAFKTRAIEADNIEAACPAMTPAPVTPMKNTEQPAKKSRRASKTRALKPPGIMLPCRVVFQTKPTSAIRNRMKDEFAAPGHLAPIERAMGLMAGYDVQLWPILQDIHQLRATYSQRAGTFLSNAGVLQVFGVNDHDCAKLVSDLLGHGTIVFETVSKALDSDRSGLCYAEQHTGRPLLTPDEVRNLPESRSLLFVAGKRPIHATKLRYFADPEFARVFDPA